MTKLEVVEDYHMYLRAAEKGYIFHQGEHPLVLYRMHKGQISSEKKGDIEAITNEIVTWNKESGRGTAIVDGPIVSVIIPTCNRPGMLRQALASVLSQTYQNIEAIVVDDGGEDVVDVIASFHDNRVVYLCHEQNRGLAAARNTGLKAAQGTYIAYLDDDHIYYPDHVETLAGFLENNGEKVAYTDSYQALQTPIAEGYVTVGKNIPFSADFDKRKLLVNNYIPINTIMHRKELLDEAGLFDEGMETHEDWDLLIRLSRQCDFHHIRRVTTEFRTRDDLSSAHLSHTADFLKTMRLIHRRYSFLVDDAETEREQKRLEARLEREVEIREAATLEDEFCRKHFYTFASVFVNNKNVLDMGCGDGQGTFILAGTAASVTGVDTGGPSLRHASARYAHNNLRFSKWPVQEKVFDVVVAYGTAKTAKTFEALTQQARGLLKEDGLFIAAIPQGKNFCAGNSGFDTCKITVEGNFKYSLVCVQKVYPVSMILPSASGPTGIKEYMVKRVEGDFLPVVPDDRDAHYLIIVASDRPLAESSVERSVLVDVSKTLLNAKDKLIQIKDSHIKDLESHARNTDSHIKDLESHASNLLRELQGVAGQLRKADEKERELLQIKGSRTYRLNEALGRLVYGRLFKNSPLLKQAAAVFIQKGPGELLRIAWILLAGMVKSKKRSASSLTFQPPAHKARHGFGPVARKVPGGTLPLQAGEDGLRLKLDDIKSELAKGLRRQRKSHE